MFQCGKCTGRVFIDRVYSENSHVELACVLCGRRWMLNKEKGVFAQWLMKVEEQRANASLSHV